MSVITSIDMSITNATEASRRIILTAIDYLREAGGENRADYLINQLADTDDDYLHELSLEAEDILNDLPGIVAGSDDGQYWQITRLSSFSLEIELGNDAMQDSYDIATALRRAAYAIECGGSGGVIHDENGHSVGEWRIK